MRIAYAQPLPSGNAAQIILNPAPGEVSWRVLRKVGDPLTTAFSGPTDPAGLQVYDGNSRYINDFLGMVNGQPHCYAIFPRNAAGAYVAPIAYAAVTPSQDFSDTSVDVQELVRVRIEAVLAAMTNSGALVLSTPSIPVLSIPFYNQTTPLPVVTVLLGSDGSDTRSLGDALGAGEFDGVGWTGSDGWLSKVGIDICAWSLNGEERNELRKAIKAAVIASLGFFDDAGMVQVDLQLRDEEDFQSMNAPIFKTVGSFTCQAPSSVSTRSGWIATVDTQFIQP